MCSMYIHPHIQTYIIIKYEYFLNKNIYNNNKKKTLKINHTAVLFHYLDFFCNFESLSVSTSKYVDKYIHTYIYVYEFQIKTAFICLNEKYFSLLIICYN